jgi:putative lipoic acid-binding regulatory protein
MPEDIGNFKIRIIGEVDPKITDKIDDVIKKSNIGKNFDAMLGKGLSGGIFSSMIQKITGSTPVNFATSGATYQSMSNREHLQPLSQFQPLENEQKKQSGLITEIGLKTIAILTGIFYTLTKVPSILGGVLSLLNFGFLLILKPLADLLAMILLPIAEKVIELADWLNEMSGMGLGGALLAALIGLILALIAGIAIASITSALITGAIETLIVSTIGAAALGVLGGALIAGVVTDYVLKLLGVDPDTADKTALIVAIVAALALALGMITFSEILILSAVVLAAGVVEKMLNSFIFEKTGIDVNKFISDTLKNSETPNILNRGGLLNPFGGAGDITKSLNITKPITNGSLNTTKATNINLTVNGTIVDKKSFMDDVVKAVNQANSTSNTRTW